MKKPAALPLPALFALLALLCSAFWPHISLPSRRAGAPDGAAQAAALLSADARRALSASATPIVPAPHSGYKDQLNPRLSEQYLVWNESTGADGSDAIFGLDLRTNSPVTVTTAPGRQVLDGISGSLVVWTAPGHTCANCERDIQAKDLATGALYNVATGPADQVEAAVSGRTVSWIEVDKGRSRLLFSNLDTGGVTEVATLSGNATFERPVIDDDYLVWAENRPEGNYGGYNSTLRALDRKSGQTKDVGTILSSGYPEYALADHRLLWTNPGLNLTDLQSGETRTIANRRVSGPSILGSYVAWSEGRNSFEIWGLQLPDGGPIPLLLDPGGLTGLVMAGD
ncbi:MAG: hypothetical protein M3014_03760, partial [Chloroflexota bacterium]|nr:hypothetical protein [Chloroflexota bacterium]